MDDLDDRLIQLLEQNPRATHAEMAASLGVSAGTVSARVRKLVDDKAIQIAVYPHPNVSDESVPVMLAIRADMLSINSVATELAEIPAITYVAVTAGHYQLIAVAEFPTREELLQFITDGLGAVSGITGVETLMLLSTAKTLGRAVTVMDKAASPTGEVVSR